MTNIIQSTDMAKIIQMVRSLAQNGALEKANKNPKEFFAQYGIPLPKNVDYTIHLDNQEFINFILPIDGGAQLNEQELSLVIASANNGMNGNKMASASSFGSVLCMSTFLTGGCFGTIVSSAMCESTVSSGGCLSTVTSAATVKL